MAVLAGDKNSHNTQEIIAKFQEREYTYFKLQCGTDCTNAGRSYEYKHLSLSDPYHGSCYNKCFIIVSFIPHTNSKR